MRIILMGIQGSGKSTQGSFLSKDFNLFYLSTGHIFREIAKEKTRWGRYVKETMGAGLLIPDSKTIKIVEEYLRKPAYQKGYILDGFPRTIAQAKKFSQEPDYVIYLKVSDREALWRLSYRNEELRNDETVTAVRKRIEAYNRYTKPVLTYYRRKSILIEIDGENSVSEVRKTIKHEILKKEKKRKRR